MSTNYPAAQSGELVGSYPAFTKSGGGYFYDEVLEYRVWCHPERGAPDTHDGEDYFCAFASYERALGFSKSTPGSEQPLVLVRQLEWVDEPEPGVLIHCRGERITEWLPSWLDGGARKPGDVESLLRNRAGDAVD